MQLGIVHQRIHPASPQENGAHERMHLELKRETTRPPASSLRGQQRKFDFFQKRYNKERPHDGIGGELPAERWEPSPRRYPERIAPSEYPGHLEVRRVSAAGTFRLKTRHSSAKMTLDVYADAQEPMQEEATAQIESVIFGGAGR